MQIEGWEVELRQSPTGRYSLVVCLHSGGHTGVGESTPPPSPHRLCSQWAEAAFLGITDHLAPRILGQWVGNPQELQGHLEEVLGNSYAKAAIDLAWWDLWARVQGISLADCLDNVHPRAREAVAWGQNLPLMHSQDELVAALAEAQSRGQQHLRLEVNPAADLEVLRALSQHSPEMLVQLACGGYYDDPAQGEALWRFTDFAPTSVEQPLGTDNLWGHACLQDNLAVDVCLSASVDSAAAVEQIVEMGAARLVALDPCRVGGLTPALGILEICQQSELQCVVQADPGLGLAGHVALLLATREGVLPWGLWTAAPVQPSGSESLGDPDGVPPGKAPEQSQARLPKTPFWGEESMEGEFQLRLPSTTDTPRLALPGKILQQASKPASFGDSSPFRTATP